MKLISKLTVWIYALSLLAVLTVIAISFLNVSGVRNVLIPSPPYTIHFVNYRGMTEINTYFEQYLKSENIDYKIIYHDVARDPGSFPKIVKDIAADKEVDLVVTSGTTVTLGIQGTYDAPVHEAIRAVPGIFAIVTDPVTVRIAPSLTSSLTNLTGTIHIAPLYNQFRSMMVHYPADAIGMLYSPSEQNSVLTEQQLRAITLMHSVKLAAIPFAVVDGRPQLGDYKAALQKLKDAGAKWLYLPPDSFLSVNAKEIIPEAHRLGLITFASTEHLMSSGAAFGLICSYAELGILAGQKAVAILRHGIDPKDIPINSPPFFKHQINKHAAAELGLHISVDMLKDIQVVALDR